MENSEIELPLDHYDSNTLGFLKPYLSQPARLLRIATGYFTLQGYNLLRTHLQSQTVRILVGFDENAPAVLHQDLVKDVMLNLSQWQDADRREAIQQIVESMKTGNFQIVKKDSVEELNLRTRQKDHAKVYILDERFVLPGSVNLSVSALLRNSENSNVIHPQGRIDYYIQQFEKNWHDKATFDVTQELLNELMRWLKLVDPFDIYLKTLNIISPKRQIVTQKASYKLPNEYQQEVVERIKQQIAQYNCAILIASTGLGKTIMAAHSALELFQRGLIRSVIVFAPVATHPDWRLVLDSAQLHNKVYTRNILDYPKKDNSYAVNKVLHTLEEVDDKTLIVVDETQYFANENKSPRRTVNGFEGGLRESFKRVHDAVQKRHARLLLMTATPFVKSPRDINNQLQLLPQTAPGVSVNRKGQYRLPIDSDELDRTWHVTETADFFEQFLKLPVATVITTSYVARNYCTTTEDGDYLDFPDGRRYLPRVGQYRSTIPISFETEMGELYKYFEHRSVSFRDRDFTRKRTKWTIQRHAIVGWMSSPLALAVVIEKTIDGTWDKKITFTHQIDERKRKLKPLLTSLKNLDWKSDVKFLSFLRILDEAIIQKRKVIVFVEVLPTAIYIERNLKKARPDIRIASSVAYDTSTKEYKTKSSRDVHRIILDFAPEANADKRPPGKPKNQYDLLITTDAFGVGVNLQDASIVVNYDQSWTPDVIIQRAGRVLRFWKEPRKVAIHTFDYSFTNPNAETIVSTSHVLRRTKTLYDRAKQATKFTELPLLAEQDQLEHNTLAELSQVVIEDMGALTPDNIDHITKVSPILDRMAERRLYRDRANNIPDDITSALLSKKLNQPLLYMLLRVEERHALVLYDIRAKQIMKKLDDEILDLIHCRPDEPPAIVDPIKIDKQASACVKLWCAQNKLELDQVERICTLLLIPPGEATFK